MTVSATTPTSATPVPPAERLDSIDILRGAALFGVLAVNLITEFRVSIFQQFLPTSTPATTSDRMVETFVSLALKSKAFCLFSLLFGVGLAIQFERLSRRGAPLRLLVRRLLTLLAIGALHLFFIWNGDILTEYSFAGLVALPFLFARNGVVLAGSATFLLLYLGLPRLPAPIPWPDAAWVSQHIIDANRVYATGSISEVLRFSADEIRSLLPLHIYVFPRTVALFLFGAFVWRAGVLRRAEFHRRTLLAVTYLGVTIGALLTLVSAMHAWPKALASAVEYLSALAPIILALGYGAAVICLVEFTAARRVLTAVAPLGRTAFSNYLLQSVVFGWIFFGYGLGLFGRLGASAALLLGIGIYALQIRLSACWLHHFRFGPLEWLWRTLMYGATQPMRVGRHARSAAEEM
jgi:uncharacterized protein